MGISRRFLKLVAEKNLLKLVLTNRQTTLQVVHNRSGNVFLQARRAARAVKLSPARRRPPSGRGQATSLEKAVRDRLPDNAPGSDRRAAAAAAEVLAERAHDLGLTQLTWERAGFRRGPGDHGKARYIAGSKVAVVIDTLRRKGISFISHVNARGSPARVQAARRG